MKHQHKFERLSDEAIFCACGEIKHTNEPVCLRQHYPTYYPWVPQPYVWPNVYWDTVTGGTSPTITTGDVTVGYTALVSGDENVTYTT